MTSKIIFVLFRSCFQDLNCILVTHFQDGTCHLDCTVPGGCGKMGYHADELKSVKSAYGKKFFMKTTSRAPYCGEKAFQISIVSRFERKKLVKRVRRD